MPFSPEFDDVYVAIKASVVAAVSPQKCQCFRLDESRPAGRITDRLLQEIKAASLCVADLTGNRPNVMWEVGYAMALGCPTIILTQVLAELPFDIRDMQSLQYDRGKLNSTLGQQLQRMIIDTISLHGRQARERNDGRELVGQLLAEVAGLKDMVAQAVRSWNPSPVSPPTAGFTRTGLTALDGAWINLESGSHAYAKVIGGDLVVPYCYRGNEEVTGVYFGWRLAGDYWFARFAWLEGATAGFTFLKQESVDTLRGAWWGDERQIHEPSAPPEKAGVPATWRRTKDIEFPQWATQFLLNAEKKGLPKRLTKRSTEQP
jgi:nucleoside 2-deoxyribosyltransferase